MWALFVAVLIDWVRTLLSSELVFRTDPPAQTQKAFAVGPVLNTSSLLSLPDRAFIARCIFHLRRRESANNSLHVCIPPGCPRSVASLKALRCLAPLPRCKRNIRELFPLSHLASRIAILHYIERLDRRPGSGGFLRGTKARCRGRVGRQRFSGSRPTEGSPEGRRAWSEERPRFQAVCRVRNRASSSRKHVAMVTCEESAQGCVLFPHPGVLSSPVQGTSHFSSYWPNDFGLKPHRWHRAGTGGGAGGGWRAVLPAGRGMAPAAG